MVVLIARAAKPHLGLLRGGKEIATISDMIPTARYVDAPAAIEAVV
jgi:hypothetical protein